MNIENFDFYTLIMIWSAIIIFSIWLEFETSTLYSIWFSVGSFIALLFAIFEFSLYIQLISFVASTIIFIITFKFIFKLEIKKIEIKTNTEALIGKEARVIKEYKEDGLFEIKVDGKFWKSKSLISSSFDIDEKVVIEGIEGNKLIIKKI